MHWVVGIGLGLLQAASVFFVVRGLGALLRKRWRSGLAALLGLALFLAGAILFGAFAYMLGPMNVDGTSIEPSQKARILAENISELMNISFWGPPLGLLLGIVVAGRDWHASARPQHMPKH